MRVGGGKLVTTPISNRIMGLLGTWGISAMDVVGHLLVFVILLATITLCQAEGSCDDVLIANQGSFQIFLPRKNELNDKCRELLENETTVCSDECNAVVKSFLESDFGSEDGMVFLRCTCGESSHIYPMSDCERDRVILPACPFLASLIPTEPTTVTLGAGGDTNVTQPITTTTTTTITPKTEAPGMDCRRAHLDCSETFGCAKAFDDVKDHCLEEFTRDGKCNAKCKQAVELLGHYRASKYIWGCDCTATSDASSWCHMYHHRDGLRAACEGVVYEVDQGVDGGDGNGANRQAVTMVLTLIIPLFILSGLVS